MACVVLEASRVADRIELEEEILGGVGRSRKFAKKLSDGQRAGGFVAVNGGEHPDANGIAAVRALKREPRQRVAVCADGERTELVGVQAGQSPQRFKKANNRAAVSLDHERFCRAVGHAAVKK